MAGRSQECDRAAGAVISFNLADAIAHKATRPGTTSRQPPHARQCNTCAPVDAAKNVAPHPHAGEDASRAARDGQVLIIAVSDAGREHGISFSITTSSLDPGGRTNCFFTDKHHLTLLAVSNTH
jgi:hypothetical protein